MKCTNCHSDDLVSIQGQAYCINCGQLVASQAPAVEATEEPESETETAEVKAVEVPEPSEKSKVPKLKPEDNAKVAGSISSDIAPLHGPTNKTLDLKKIEQAKKDPKPARAASKIEGHPWRVSAQIALITALPAALAVAAALYARLDTDILVFAIAPGIILATATAATLAQAAVMYGLSKKHDGRPTPPGQWWMMASQSTTELLQLNIFAFLTIALCTSIGAFAWQASAVLSESQPVVRLVLLLLLNALLIWLICGTLVARRLAEAAIVINDVPLGLSIRLGLGMFWRIGGHLVAAAGESLAISAGLGALGGLVGFAIWYSRTIVGTAWHPALYAAGVFAGLFMFIAVGLHTETRLWVSQYRHWAPLCYPDKRAEDLTTSRTSRPKPA